MLEFSTQFLPGFLFQPLLMLCVYMEICKVFPLFAGLDDLDMLANWCRQLVEYRPGTCYLGREWQCVANWVGSTRKDLNEDC